MEALSRAKFANTLFQNEYRVYSELKSRQGKSIARFLGYFQVRMPHRELKEDREINVLMFNILEGMVLANTPASKIEGIDPKKVRSHVLETLKILHQHEILFPKMSLRKFLISDEDRLPKAFGFSVTFNGGDYKTKEQREDHKRSDLVRISRELDKLGYLG